MKQNLFRKWFGYPVFTLDYDGDVRKSRLYILPDGTYIVKKVLGYEIANKDGTFGEHSYMIKWMYR